LGRQKTDGDDSTAPANQPKNIRLSKRKSWLAIVTPVKKQVGGKSDVYLSRHTLEFRSRISQKKRGAVYAVTPHGFNSESLFLLILERS
jgi:hypothetical protein